MLCASPSMGGPLLAACEVPDAKLSIAAGDDNFTAGWKDDPRLRIAARVLRLP